MDFASSLFKAFPEFDPAASNSMRASGAFWKGLGRRIIKQNKNISKVFVVGFHKTGTSSMGKALQILGYRVCGSIREAYGFDPEIQGSKFILEKATPLLTRYDAFQDTPWFMVYKELYQLYPDAKFILTKRESRQWINSIVNHFGGSNHWKFHKWIYGEPDPVGNENHYLKVYENHNQAVEAFFCGNPNFLVLNLSKSYCWERLTSLLNEKKTIWSFPHANKKIRNG